MKQGGGGATDISLVNGNWNSFDSLKSRIMVAAVGGGGGSSFISGHNGCDAITETSTENNIVHTGQSIHYSGYQFTNTVMIDGKGYNWTTQKGSYIGIPTHDGTSTMTGNSGNGYAKITFLKSSD